MSEPDLERVRRLLIDAMALPTEQHEVWLELAEQKLYAERAREHPFQRMYDVSTLGARIRTAREALGLSQPQAALRIGVSRPILSRWELGRSPLPAMRLHVLCTVLAVKKEWLLGMSEEGGPAIPREQQRKRITKRWKERQTFLARRAKARQEVAELNARYRAEYKTG